MAREGRTGRRYAVLGFVIAAHGLLVVLLLERQEKINAQVDSSVAPLIFLSLPAPIQRADNATPPVAAKPERSAALPARARSSPSNAITNLNLQALPFPSDSLPLGLGLDWDHEAQHAANSQAESLFKELRQLCEEAALRGETPPGCRHYRAPDPWKPEPKKFGFAGGLPYMRLGKRCIIGLGFFGCGVGKLPEANGHVLDDMRDPDRPYSSVPDPNDPD